MYYQLPYTVIVIPFVEHSEFVWMHALLFWENSLQSPFHLSDCVSWKACVVTSSALGASFSGLGNCVHNNHEKESTWRWSTPRYNFVTIMWPTCPGVNAFSQYRKRNMQWVKLISLNLETSCCTYNLDVPWNEKHPGSMKKYKKVSQIVGHFSLSNQIKSYLSNMRVLAILSIALSATIGK